jgi:hypothetical protein
MLKVFFAHVLCAVYNKNSLSPCLLLGCRTVILKLFLKFLFILHGANKLWGVFCKTIFSQILNRNTWCYYHLKEECLQFHCDLKCIRCAPHARWTATKLLHRANSRTHQLRSVGEAAIFFQHWFTLFPRDDSSDYRTIPNVSSLCVIDTNFTILRHFLLKFCRNEILS